MDLKEYMQKKAEDPILSELSEEDREYCRQLEVNSSEKSAVKAINDRRRFWIFFSCAAAILVAAVILICIFVPKKSPLKYLEANIVSQTSNITELEKDLKDLDFVILDTATYSFALCYDSDSGDNLYYEVFVNDFYENAHIIFVINKNYTYQIEEHKEQLLKKQMDGYELNYYEGVAVGFSDTQYTGWIKLKSETVYITYTQTPTLDENAFFAYVQSVIQAK